MKRNFLIFILTIASIFLGFRPLNLFFAKEIKYPLYKGIFGDIIIKTGKGKYLSIIENEMFQGDLKKINQPINTIDIKSFHLIEDGKGAITRYEDTNYFYLLHDGEEKILIREKK